jgi:DNA sulfur modification protein DndE
VCRAALLLSLEDGAVGGEKQCDQEGSEFNSVTLFGEHGLLFECLIREVHGELELKACAMVVTSHIESGLDRLRKSKNFLELMEFSGMHAALN